MKSGNFLMGEVTTNFSKNHHGICSVVVGTSAGRTPFKIQTRISGIFLSDMENVSGIRLAAYQMENEVKKTGLKRD
jgi:hypothetical protein